MTTIQYAVTRHANRYTVDTLISYSELEQTIEQPGRTFSNQTEAYEFARQCSEKSTSGAHVSRVVDYRIVDCTGNGAG